MRRVLVGLLVLGYGALSLRAQSTMEAPTAEPIAAWIKQLGDPAYGTRERATQELMQAGGAALAALKAAMNDADAEVSSRAQTVYKDITEPPPARVAELNANAAKAYAEADYATAAKYQMLLACRRRAMFEECMAVGNDWQLTDAWDKAVKGYQRALERVDEVLGGDPERDPPPTLAPNGPGRGAGMNGGGGRRGPAGPEGLTDQRRQELLERRSGLLLLIGRLQRDRLLDPIAAIATLNRVAENVPELQGDLAKLLPQLAAEYPTLRDEARKKSEVNWDKIGLYLRSVWALDCMEDLASTQEAQGKFDDAILTLARAATLRNHSTYEGLDEDIAHLAKLLARAPASTKLPGAAEIAKAAPAATETPKMLRITMANGGALTLDKAALPATTPVEKLGAGPHDIVYTPEGGKGAVRVSAAFKPGHDYNLFFNADSPFQWTLTNLGDFNLGSMTVSDFVQRPDKTWVAVLDAGSKIYLTTSRDLATWDVPWELAHNGVANNMYGAITVDDRGTLWLAWVANPGSLQPRGSGGYALWVSSSADGKMWTAPRAINANVSGWPLGKPTWWHDQAFHLAWGNTTGSAATPGAIQALAASLDQKPPMNPDMTVDDAGGFTLTNERDGRTYLRNGNLENFGHLSEAIAVNAGATSRFRRSGDSTVGFTSGEAPFLLSAKTLVAVGGAAIAVPAPTPAAANVRAAAPVATASVAATAPPPDAAVRGTEVYRSVFEHEEWSKKTVTRSPSGKHTFLGPFSNESTVLSLDNLPEHGRVRLSFDLMIIQTWDGDLYLDEPVLHTEGPDLFDVTVDRGPRLVHASFVAAPTSASGTQSFPGRFPYDHLPAGTDAAESRTLGYHYLGNNSNLPDDYVYHIERSFAHGGRSLKIAFSGIHLQGVDDESWGLENVRVEVLPAGPAREFQEDAFGKLWMDLGAEDWKLFVPAIDGIIDLGDPGVAAIRKRLAPAATNVDPDSVIQKWIAQLDSDSYKEREAASAALQELGAAAEAALRTARQGATSPEVITRVDVLLARLKPGQAEGETGRRLRRLVEILERIGTEQARTGLSDIAGCTGSLAAWEAKAAIERLDGKAEIPTTLDVPPGMPKMKP